MFMTLFHFLAKKCVIVMVKIDLTNQMGHNSVLPQTHMICDNQHQQTILI